MTEQYEEAIIVPTYHGEWIFTSKSAETWRPNFDATPEEMPWKLDNFQELLEFLYVNPAASLSDAEDMRSDVMGGFGDSMVVTSSTTLEELKKMASAIGLD